MLANRYANPTGARPRLRVLLLSTQRTWGGGEEQARLIVRGLTARACDVLTAAPADSALASLLRQLGFPVFSLPHRARGPSAWLALRRAMRWFRPHVLFMNDPHAVIHGLLASLGLPVARIGARRTVFRLRSGWLYRQMLDGVVCSSLAAAQACRQAGILSQRISIIYDGVDLGRIRQANPIRGRQVLTELARNCGGAPPSGSDQGDPESVHSGNGSPGTRFIVHVGKLTPAKGQDDLITAFAGLAKDHSDVAVVLIGDGEWRSHLEARVATLGLSNRVFFPGFRTDALDIVAAADVFVFPSREEGLGGALIEALLLGVPVVASSAGGIPEVLNDNPPLGLMVPPADPAALQGAIKEVLNLPEEQRGTMTRRAKAIATMRFSEDQMVSQLAELLHRVVSSKHLSPHSSPAPR